jgi:hypothetical protein
MSFTSKGDSLKKSSMLRFIVHTGYGRAHDDNVESVGPGGPGRNIYLGRHTADAPKLIHEIMRAGWDAGELIAGRHGPWAPMVRVICGEARSLSSHGMVGQTGQKPSGRVHGATRGW